MKKPPLKSPSLPRAISKANPKFKKIRNSSLFRIFLYKKAATGKPVANTRGKKIKKKAS